MKIKVTSEQELINVATESEIRKIIPEWDSVKLFLYKTVFYLNKKNRPYQTFDGKMFWLFRGERYLLGNNRIRMHKYVWEYYNGKPPAGYDIHHKDHNRFNNDINNLELIPEFDHHSSHMKERYKENKEWFIEFAKKGREAGKEWYKTEEGVKQKPERIKKGKRIWENVPIRTSYCEFCGVSMTYKCIQPKKYCSSNCKQKNKVKREQTIKNCEFCGISFSCYKNATKPIRFCSRSCVSKKMHKDGKGKNKYRS